MKNKLAIEYALACYILYGLMPIYWKYLSVVLPIEILAHRVVWSSCFLTVILIFSGKLRIPTFKTILVCLTTGNLLLINWGTFVYAIHANRNLECSLGYFLFPITNALLGYLFFKESYSRNQKIAFVLFIIAVLYLSIIEAAIPVIPLTLSLSLSLYGLVRKKFQIPALSGLWLETVVILPLALIYLYYSDTNFLKLTFPIQLGLMGTGIMTTVPLFFLLKAIEKLNLSLLGVLQYINPTLQFILAIFLYREEISLAKLFAFILIWMGIFLYFLRDKRILERSVQVSTLCAKGAGRVRF